MIMKKLIGIITLLFLMLALFSCDKKEQVDFLCVYKEYDMELQSENFLDQLKDIYSEPEYIVTEQNPEYFFIIPAAHDELKKYGTLIVEVFPSASEAHAKYVEAFLGIDVYYRYGLLRINNIILYGQSDMLKPLMLYFEIDFPDEKRICGDSKIIKYEKEIDFEKLVSLLQEQGYKIYQDIDSYSGNIHYIMINETGTALLGGYTISNPEEFFEVMLSTNHYTAGSMVCYQNISFIMLENFWIDIIEQCEK